MLQSQIKTNKRLMLQLFILQSAKKYDYNTDVNEGEGFLWARKGPFLLVKINK